MALVTGGNRGLGRAIAIALADYGATVLLGSREAQRGLEAERELAAAGVAVSAVALDVTDVASVEALADSVVRDHGRLDILINNAGVSIAEPTVELTADSMAQTFAVNVFGVVTVINAMLPALRSSEAARIVNVSSRMGSLALASEGTKFHTDVNRALAYSASKAALNMLTIRFAETFALEPGLAHIKINAATPGYTATEMTDRQGRSASDGARLIVDLATVGPDGPTGRFFNDQGAVPW